MENSFVAKHWRGDYSLVVSYWLIGFVFSKILSYAADPVITALPSLAIGVLAALIGYQIWASVGIWRSAGKYIAELPSMGLWGRAARVAVVFGWVMLLIEIVAVLGA